MPNPPLSPDYAKSVRALVRATQRRLGDTPLSASSLVDQLALRSAWLSHNSANRDRRALKVWLNVAYEDPALAIQAIAPAAPSDAPDLPQLLASLFPIDERTRGELEDTLARRIVDLAETGRALLDDHLDRFQADDPTVDPDSLIETIVGFSKPGTLIKFGRASGPRYVPLTADVLEAMSHQLDPRRDHIALLRSIASGEPDRAALAALLFRSSWYAGLRPFEWWQSTLLIQVDGDVIDAESYVMSVAEGRRRPPLSNVSIDPAELITAHCSATRTRPVLKVVNAKQTNANPLVAQPERMLFLDEIPNGPLRDIYFASQLRHLWSLYEDRYNTLLTAMTRYVARAHSKLYPDAAAVSLNTPRHDFVERAKQRFTRPEAAALAGHTGRRSPAHYGNKYTRQSMTGVDRTAWLPKPDPHRAREIHLLWQKEEAAHPSPFARA